MTRQATTGYILTTCPVGDEDGPEGAVCGELLEVVVSQRPIYDPFDGWPYAVTVAFRCGHSLADMRASLVSKEV